MKPDWSSKNVPAWAEWAAQEPSGSWYWYSHRPVYSEICTEWQTKGQREIIPKVELRAQDTLERRPESETMVDRFVRQRDEQADSRISAWFRSWNAQQK